MSSSKMYERTLCHTIWDSTCQEPHEQRLPKSLLKEEPHNATDISHSFSLAKAILMNSYVLWYETSIESEVDLTSQQATPVLEGFAPQRSSQNRIKGMEPTIIIPHPNIFVPMAHYTTRDKWIGYIHLLVSCNFSMLEIF